MRITQIEIYQSKIKLKKPFIISLGVMAYSENLIVVIRTDSKIIGFGECSPFKTIHGESMDTGFIVASYFAKELIGKNPLEIENCLMLMDTIIHGNPSIKSAFDIALFDIASQNASLPLYSFLGGRKNKTITTDYTISLNNKEEMVEDALQILKNGFKIIKVKLGDSKDKDVERIRSIRKAIGNEITLRIDANQGWTFETAIETLIALAPFNIQHCEEPIPKWDFMNLPAIKKNSPIPIMADESCFSHHDANRLIGLDACDSLNIKLGKSAGIFGAKKIIDLADKAGIKMQVGGFLESRLGFTASAHMALTSNNIIHYDFDTPLMFVDDPVVGGITYGKNGHVAVPEIPGLGATIDQSYLNQLPSRIFN